MTRPWPYRAYPPNPAVRAPASHKTIGLVSLILALLAWLAAGLAIYFMSASHAMTSGCIIDEQMVGAAIISEFGGGLLSFIAAVTGLAALIGPRRTRGAYRVMGVAGLLLGAVALVVCALLLMGSMVGGHPNPKYLHPC
jgi:hypothetical protein